MTAQEFQQSEARRVRLAEILDDPVFKEAVAVLENEQKPRGDLALFQSLEVSAHRYHQFAGMTYFTDGLKRLSNPVKRVAAPRGKQLRTLQNEETSSP